MSRLVEALGRCNAHPVAGVGLGFIGLCRFSCTQTSDASLLEADVQRFLGTSSHFNLSFGSRKKDTNEDCTSAHYQWRVVCCTVLH